MAEIAFGVRLVGSPVRTFGVAALAQELAQRGLAVAADRHFECTMGCFGVHIGRIAAKHFVGVLQSFVVAAFGQELLVGRQLADTLVLFVQSMPVADIGQHSCSVKAMLDLLVVAVAVLVA